jgi:hypothetical protein
MKYKLRWSCSDTIEADSEGEAIFAFIDLINDAYYGPIPPDIEVEINK